MRVGRLVGIVLFAAVTTISCAPSSGQPTESTGAVFSDPSRAALDDAIALRRSWGLRSDETWVRLALLDPAAVANAALYGTPVTAAERAELDRRVRNSDDIEDVIMGYGASRPEWAGLFLDLQADGAVVALFTANLPEHRAAIVQLVGPEARWEVRQARWSWDQLTTFQRLVEGDQGWLAEVDAAWAGTGIATDLNVVTLSVSSGNPDVVSQVLAHYGNESWLRVESDGIGPWLGGTGSLMVVAVDKSGSPVADLFCVLTPDDPTARVAEDLWTTDRLGRCRIPGLPSTGYVVELKRDATGSADWVTVGGGHADVPDNGEGRVEVTVN